jgi:hypothetical protein
MVLVAEDGTGLEAANSYADVEHARAFHTERGSEVAWLGFENLGMAVGGLLQATAMLDSSYVWRGVVLNPEQGLKLPRQTFLDSDFRQITPELQIAKAADACALLALRLLQDPPGGANVSSERFADYSITYSGAKRRSYADVDAILSGLFAAGGLGGGMRNVEVLRTS